MRAAGRGKSTAGRGARWRSLVSHAGAALPVTLTLTALTLLQAAPAAAWGRLGHATVVEVAVRHLSPPARAALLELLAGEDLDAASVWADEIDLDASGEDTAPWHYVSLGPGERWTAERGAGGDVVRAIRRQRDLLADRDLPTARRADAARWLLHLVGDVHQPLHVGFAEDRGGNDVTILFRGETINLHRLLDWTLLGSADDPRSLADRLAPATAAELAAWRRAELMDWVAESQALRSVAYAGWVPPEPGAPDGAIALEEWQTAPLLPLLERRLLMAGVRLAALLEAALLGGGSSP